MFKKNMGNIDRILRFIAGTALIGGFFIFPESPYRMFRLIGFIPLITSLISSCPLYSIFGMSTCPMKK